MERLILDAGVLSAVLPRHRPRHHPVEEYTVDVARAHARLLAPVRRAGQPRGAHDLIIAATALTTARTVVTHDKRARFDDLPGVRVRQL